MEGFKERIIQEMVYKDLNVPELSKRTGISARTLQNYLKRNPQEPSVSNAYKIAQALDVSLEWLVTGNPCSITNSFVKADLLRMVERLKELAEDIK